MSAASIPRCHCLTPSLPFLAIYTTILYDLTRRTSFPRKRQSARPLRGDTQMSSVPFPLVHGGVTAQCAMGCKSASLSPQYILLYAIVAGTCLGCSSAFTTTATSASAGSAHIEPAPVRASPDGDESEEGRAAAPSASLSGSASAGSPEIVPAVEAADAEAAAQAASDAAAALAARQRAAEAAAYEAEQAEKRRVQEEEAAAAAAAQAKAEMSVDARGHVAAAAASTINHSKRSCNKDCTGGKCKFEGCKTKDPENGPRCSGGRCVFIDCDYPTCKGGLCSFISCLGATCRGGKCDFMDSKSTLRDGYCTGGGCRIDGLEAPSNFAQTLVF